MPIKSYLVYPVRGKREALAQALRAVGACEVIPATTHDVLVLVTDTPHEEAERVLQSALDQLPDLQCLTLVAGLDDPDALGAPLRMSHQESSHDPS